LLSKSEKLTFVDPPALVSVSA